MKYLCLVYLDEEKLAAAYAGQGEHLSDEECLAYDEAIRKQGYCLASEALQPVRDATTVRVRGGQVSLTDGPFAETKEQLAGFYLIEARDLNAAIRIASGIPPARIGCVEVRPLRELMHEDGRARTRLAPARGA